MMETKQSIDCGSVEYYKDLISQLSLKFDHFDEFSILDFTLIENYVLFFNILIFLLHFVLKTLQSSNF